MIGRLDRPDGARWSALAGLALAMMLSMTTWFSASAVLPTLRTLWSLDSGLSALLTVSVQLGFVTGALVSAITNLSDRVPARWVFIGSCLGAAIVNGLIATASGVEITLPLRFLTGVFVAGIYPPALKIMATHVRTGRGLALGTMVGALTIGSALPHLVNGIGGLPWQVVVLASSAMTIAGGLIVLFLVPDGPYPFPRGSFEPRFILRALRDPAVRLANIGYFGHMWELYAMWSWFGLFFGDSVRASGGDAGTAGSLAAFTVIASGAVGCVAGGILGDRWGRTRTTTLALAVSGSCAAIIGLTFGGPPAIVLVVGIVWGIAVVADSAQFSTMVTELADQAYVGTALTMQLAIGFSLTVVTIWVIPIVRDQVGWPWAFLLLTPGPAIGAFAMLRLGRRPEAALIAGGRG